MGRPLKQKFFDASSSPSTGGEPISSLSFSNVGGGYYTANVAITLGAPNLAGGTTATVTNITLFGNGAINTYTLNGGSGYIVAPSVTITGANTTPAVATAVVAAGTVANVVAISAYVPGGASAVVGDIIKQTGARTYKVRTAQGTGKCKLVTAAPGAGEMTITATDSNGSTYYVKKLEENKCTLVRNSGSTWDYVTGAKAKWTITGSAVAPTASDIGTVVVSNN